VDRREWRWLAWAGLALILASNLPYLVAWAATPEGDTFTGLIFNPQDGNSYIAKMRQGLNGSWRFRLPYTPERQDGAAVFLFHLLLGHIARWTGLPLVLIYHGARVVGGVVMLGGIYALARSLSDSLPERGTMFLLTSLGSGLGWLVGPAGVETADLWVPEAFPSYSLLANAHFPFAIGLMANAAVCGTRLMDSGVVEGARRRRSWSWGLGMLVAATLLGTIQPFGLVPVFGGLAVAVAARGLRERSVPWRAGLWVGGAALLALIYPLYAQVSIRSDPILAAWSLRNRTPSPPLWDWALSYGVILVLSVPGFVVAIRRGANGDLVLLGWALVTLIGMYLPLALQRRVSLGLGVPLGLLAGLGWWRWLRPHVGARRRGAVQGLLVALSALTPVFLIVAASFSALSGDPWFYLTAGERAAFEWLRDHGQTDAVVLCAPRTGTFVPAWAGQPVVYGHPFETVDAERRRAAVVAYLSGGMRATEEAFLQANRVGYILVGPRERALGATGQSGEGAEALVFEAAGVRVYEVNGG
jgi:hypothetical protein